MAAAVGACPFTSRLLLSAALFSLPRSASLAQLHAKTNAQDGFQVVAKKLLARQTSGHEMSMASVFQVRISLLCVVVAWFARVRALTAPSSCLCVRLTALRWPLLCFLTVPFVPRFVAAEGQQEAAAERVTQTHSHTHSQRHAIASVADTLPPSTPPARCALPVDAHSCFRRCMRFQLCLVSMRVCFALLLVCAAMCGEMASARSSGILVRAGAQLQLPWARFTQPHVTHADTGTKKHCREGVGAHTCSLDACMGLL